jgi:hypothetical protein
LRQHNGLCIAVENHQRKNTRNPIHHAITSADFSRFCHHAAITCDVTRSVTAVAIAGVQYWQSLAHHNLIAATALGRTKDEQNQQKSPKHWHFRIKFRGCH